MFRWLACNLLIVFTLTGCATARRPSQPARTPELSQQAQLSSADVPVASTDVETPVEEPDAGPALALVFDPAVADLSVAPALSRGGREPRAFLGYDEGVTEFFSLRVDDRQYSGPGSFGFGFGVSGYGSYDRYERRAVSVRAGVRYR